MGLDGQGIAVAVIDSGIGTDKDFHKRLVARKNFYSNPRNVNDTFGHGTHVAGIIGGSGADSDGLYAGIAPGVNLISLKIGNNGGMAYESDAVEAMQWVLEHKDRYNIRVVNLSINSTVEQSYHDSPLGAAAEILWFNRVVVVASAGNTGKEYNTISAAPASDPFVITVGAANENGDSNPANDTVASFSPSGTTLDDFVKPDIVAPGQGIVSVLSRRSDWDEEYPDRVVHDGQYFRLSGTSMSAPMVSGAVALLLQDEPHLTPDQVKYRLVNASSRSVDGQPYLDVYAVVTADTDGSLNTGLEASQLLWSGDEPVEWDSVNWNSVNWNSVNWNSVNWNSVNWNSVNWNSVAWND
jgi:serine protease AprX